MPPKKERGKQRKAAKSLALANGVGDISKTVALIRKGNNDATVRVDCGTTQSLMVSNGILYEQSGILSTILKFLKRCEDDTFVKVMLDIGGNLKTPSSWVRVLIKAEAQEESCRLQIAQNIGPLVRCVCNDTTRSSFFKSNTHWPDTIRTFVSLIHNMILHLVDNSDKTKGKKIVDTLLQYEELLTSIVQWGFWEEEYRPDITKVITTDARVDIVRLGKATVIRLINAADTQTGEGKQRLETIGTTPIISKEYDPECTISFVVGLVRQTKIEGWTMVASRALRRLIINGNCVDKDVITELIGLGIINTRDDRWITHVAVLLRYMLLKENINKKYNANDTRAAFAIRGGLIELCLTFIERFGLNESFDKKRDNLSSPFFSIQSILANIYWIQLHKKTAEAIRSKKCDIEQELQRLEENADITSNVNCKKLLDNVRSILDINGSYCCRCNKSLSRTEVKLCNGCNIMAYCSKACQKEDWLNGHSESCCKTHNNEISGLYQVGQFQGRILPRIMPENERAAAKLKELEVNMNMIQLKLFHDHSETMLSQASSLDIPLYDCVVYFDLRKYPLVVKVKKWTEFYNNPILKRGFEGSRSKKNITCIFISYLFGQTPKLQMQRLFPHEWLSKKKAEEIDNVDD